MPVDRPVDPVPPDGLLRAVEICGRRPGVAVEGVGARVVFLPIGEEVAVGVEVGVAAGGAAEILLRPPVGDAVAVGVDDAEGGAKGDGCAAVGIGGDEAEAVDGGFGAGAEEEESFGCVEPVGGGVGDGAGRVERDVGHGGAGDVAIQVDEGFLAEVDENVGNGLPDGSVADGDQDLLVDVAAGAVRDEEGEAVGAFADAGGAGVEDEAVFGDDVGGSVDGFAGAVVDGTGEDDGGGRVAGDLGLEVDGDFAAEAGDVGGVADPRGAGRVFAE